MLTEGSGRAKQATGEVRPHSGKTSEVVTSEVWHRGQADDAAATDVVATRYTASKKTWSGYSAVNRGRMGRLSGKCGMKLSLSS